MQKMVHIVSRNLSHWWYIECENCHYCGETKLFLVRAIKSWNKTKLERKKKWQKKECLQKE